MPSTEHELFLTLLDDDPSILVSMLPPSMAPDLERAQCVSASATFATLNPATYSADRVYRFLVDGVVKLSLIVEAARSFTPGKPLVCVHYTVYEMVRTGAPVQLVVVTDDPNIARAAAEPVPIGLLGDTVRLLVIGPDTLALARDLDAASASPIRVLLAAVLTRQRLDRAAAEVAFRAAQLVGEPRESTFYLDALLAKHPRAIRDILESTMPVPENYQVKSPYLREWLARVEALGDAREATGEARGIELGERRARDVAARAVRDVCGLLGIPLDDAREARLATMSLDELDTLRMQIFESRRWPTR